MAGLTASVRLIQGTAVPAYRDSDVVLVELMLGVASFEQPGDEEFFVVLRGDPARTLGRMLVSASQEAAR